MKGYRTIIWNALNVILAGMQAVMDMSGTAYTIPPEYMMPWLIVFGLVNGYLRKVTTTPLGKKE